MKKILLILTLLIIFITILLTSISTYLSYKIIRPQVKEVNLSLEDEFTKVVNIPRDNARLNLDFNNVFYFWEMETPQNEVVGVYFRYDPDYFSRSDVITTKLEMAEGGDASIFNKTLPALIIDPESLSLTQDATKEIASVALNKKFKDVTIERNENNQATAIFWTYERGKIASNSKAYSRLNSYPRSVLRILYEIPNFIVSLFAG